MTRSLWRQAWSAVRQARGTPTPVFPFCFAATHAYASREKYA